MMCAAVIIINLTNTWNNLDQWTLDRATKRCEQIWPDAPCLKKFIKKQERLYNAICGDKNG